MFKSAVVVVVVVVVVEDQSAAPTNSSSAVPPHRATYIHPALRGSLHCLWCVRKTKLREDGERNEGPLSSVLQILLGWRNVRRDRCHQYYRYY